MENVSTETNMPQEAALKRRSRFSFSLRTLLILFAVVAALLHFWIIPSEKQRRACDKIIASNGYFNLTSGHHINAESDHLHWYMHFIYGVNEVFLNNDPGIDDWSAFSNLNELLLIGDWNCDRILKNSTFPKDVISVTRYSYDKKISAESIALFASLPNLEELDIFTKAKDVFDECNFETLLRFPKLKKLRLSLWIGKPKYSKKVYDNIERLKKKIPHCSIEIL